MIRKVVINLKRWKATTMKCVPVVFCGVDVKNVARVMPTERESICCQKIGKLNTNLDGTNFSNIFENC